MRKNIEFKSKGVTCRGWFYTPDKGKGPFPTIVHASGWAYVKEMVMPQYAESFAKVGVASLVFDYRTLGASDGEPRQHIDLFAQIEDVKNGISFVQTLPEVDPERVGVWGISYGGGHVLIVGATDPRVKCILSIVPAVDGYEMMQRNHGTEGMRRMRKAIIEDRKKRFETGVGGYIPMCAVDHWKTLCAWPFGKNYEVFMEIKKTIAPAHEHRNTIESMETVMSYNVFPFLYRILDIPTLMVVAPEDDHCWWDWEIKAFNQIPSPYKKLVILPRDVTHMSLYVEKTEFEMIAKACTDWLVEYLVKPYE
ncbi:MAG: peptidase S15 [Deltaproteobacteria bacterium RBG_16_48_10]|nr:MAG: peptidase S15 [Deltaproteobacteria bacterium RBG_16_48_10]